jgi:hypothetical protein
MIKQHLNAALSEITADNLTNGSLSKLWDKLPDYVGGPNWIGEIVNAADQWQGYVYDDVDYSLDRLTDYVGELADSEIQDYYVNINKRVQDLSLWAYPEIDQDVAELFGGYSNDEDRTITGLNSLYLYAATRSLFYAIIEYAYERAEELRQEFLENWAKGLTNA